ncbi:hypothetical protein Dsin_011614 [Dipteronia sinensis]|uniref:RNase H type-1 domain-containing protein n=1 Tax=Dipteronia sinensis TaxID=43782 RepID=A0AAE0E7E5_9ROSI|nr:hypothetical protein Dsin_011614 [Dipteronia sinensis]
MLRFEGFTKRLWLANSTGVGLVIRDHCGTVVASSSQQVEAYFSPQIAEAVAILRCMIFAVDSGLVPAVIESDALGVVNFVNKVSYVPTKANFVAYALAKLILNLTEDLFWMET